jgi:hypothetical protein
MTTALPSKTDSCLKKEVGREVAPKAILNRNQGKENTKNQDTMKKKRIVIIIN